ncbi:MAG: hypothetical protein ACI33K_06315 [Clostridiaceae bacterium]
MKKLMAVLIVLLMSISLVACSSPSDNDSQNNIGSEDISKENTPEKPKAATIEEQVLFDDQNIKITAKSLEVSGSLFGPEIKLIIENNSTENITVQANHVSVNGIMVDNSLSSDVAAGKKANDALTLYSSELELASIDTIKDIEFIFNIFNTDTWDTIVLSDRINITTSAASYEQAYDDSGTVALDENGIKIVVKKIDSEESFWGADVLVYIENNREQDVTIQAQNVSVNGFMVDPIFSSDVLAGKKAFDTITFMESDLTDNSITDITDIELSFHIFDLASWDTIFDSSTIRISF